MGKYRGYEEYKDSGVEWLGEIPEHWEVKRVKYAFLLQRGYDLSRDEMEEGIYPVCASNGIIGYHTSFNVKAPSITVGRSGSVGEINYISHDFWAHNTALYVKNFINSEPRFIFYLLNTLDVKSLSWGTAVGTLNRNYIHDLLSGFPPPDEQKAIARFLDHKTKQIDDLIAKKEALIEKLDEKRTALISHAVTKGLDPNVPMKDSGIEWLGEIPQHWEVKRLRFLMVMYGGSTPDKNNPEFWNGEIPWLSAKDMKTERLISSIDKITEQALKETSIRLHEKGCIVIVVRGMILAHSFPVAINDIAITINQDLKILKKSLNAEFLAILLRGIKNLILSIMEESGHGTKVLRTDLFKNVFLPSPPLDEQKFIVNFVEKQTLKIDQQKAKIQEAIALLKEYRTALITNAVTGKIDVRQVPIP